MHTLQHKQALFDSQSSLNATAGSLASCTVTVNGLEGQLAESKAQVTLLEDAVLSSGRMQLQTWKELDQVMQQLSSRLYAHCITHTSLIKTVYAVVYAVVPTVPVAASVHSVHARVAPSVLHSTHTHHSKPQACLSAYVAL
jgi:hypothetical protein